MVELGYNMSIAIVVRIIGVSTSMKLIANFVQSSWGVHSNFHTKEFGDSFKITFKSQYDYEQLQKIEYT